MNKLLLIMFGLLILVMATACNVRKIEVLNEPATNCTVSKSNGAATITCPDGTSTTISDGSSGSKGDSGISGVNGHSAAISMTSASLSICPNGGQIISMGIDLNNDTILQVSETTQIATICNGLNGTNGTNGINAPPTPFSPVGIVNPCGDAPGIDDEVFLKLSNGMLLWSESDNIQGLNTRFSVARAGTWQTTDGDSCVFTIDSGFNITYENHHY